MSQARTAAGGPTAEPPLPAGLSYPPGWRGWAPELAAVRADAHPEANLYPITRDDVVAMALSLKDKGLIEPIIREAGKLLEGRTRFLGCRLAGVPVRTTGRSGAAAALSRWD